MRRGDSFWQLIAVIVILLWMFHLYAFFPSELSSSLVVLSPEHFEKSEGQRPYISPPVVDNSYNFSVAICAIAKDAEAYLEEWLDFHLIGMKFQNIYLYDNSDGFDLKQWYENTREHPIYSAVEIVHHPGNSYIEEEDAYVQNIISTECVERFGRSHEGPQHDYIALFDLDEFVVPQQYPHKYRDIREILQDYLVPYGGALLMNWMLFGTSNKTLYAPIPVTKRFQYRDEETHYVVKSIVKSSDFNAIRNPHAVSLTNGAKVRTTKYPGCLHTDLSSKTGASDHGRPSDIMLLYHFRYTSTKEYLWKRCSRGNLSVKYRWCTKEGTLRNNTPSHIQPRSGMVHDTKAWRLLSSEVPRYRLFDQWPDLS